MVNYMNWYQESFVSIHYPNLEVELVFAFLDLLERAKIRGWEDS